MTPVTPGDLGQGKLSRSHEAETITLVMRILPVTRSWTSCIAGGHLLCPGGSQMETRRAICNFLDVNKSPRQQVVASTLSLTPNSLILSPLFVEMGCCSAVSRCPRPLASVTSPGHLVKSSINFKKVCL